MLNSLRREMEHLPALAAIDVMMRATCLIARITGFRKISAVAPEPAGVWALLRAEAAEAEANGESWKELAARLLQKAELELPELLPAEGREAIVLMTCQKAKGQEWPVVILPGLSRPLRPPPAYRHNIEVLMTPDVLASRVKGIRTRNWKTASEWQRVRADHELRRVYYVACTRAKKHLILADARELWPGASTLTRPLEALSAPGEEDRWLSDLHSWKPPVGQRAADASRSSTMPLPADLNVIKRLDAVKIVHPSQQDQERIVAQPEDHQERWRSERRVEPLHGALVYGNWWHEQMQFADWSSKKVEAELRRAVEDLPEGLLRERANTELDRLAASDLWKALTAPSTVFYREVPYVRVPEAGTVEDGKIDLIYRRGAGRWSLLDWKTDLVGDKTEARQRYQSQMTAYVTALRGFGIEIDSASLYFTTIGELVFIST